uniref:Uncharacterized protein n=1 Tax=Oryza brachyantha TaxID=4533 RepID=J3LX73_ORYBR
MGPTSLSSLFSPCHSPSSPLPASLPLPRRSPSSPPFPLVSPCNDYDAGGPRDNDKDTDDLTSKAEAVKNETVMSVVETPLLRSAFYFKEALRLALSPTSDVLAPSPPTPRPVASSRSPCL